MSTAPAETAMAPAADTTAIGQPIKRTLPQYETVSIEDEGAASRADLDFFKGTRNFTNRIGILGIESIAAARTHFSDVVGSVICRSEFVRQQTQGPDGKKIFSDQMVKKAGCCELLG